MKPTCCIGEIAEVLAPAVAANSDFGLHEEGTYAAMHVNFMNGMTTL